MNYFSIRISNDSDIKLQDRLIIIPHNNSQCPRAGVQEDFTITQIVVKFFTGRADKISAVKNTYAYCCVIVNV